MNMKKLTIPEMQRLSPEDFKQTDKIPLVLILDNIRSLRNIGSIFRSSDAFRVERIYLCGLSCTPPHPEIHKTALGAEYSVSWQYEKEAIDVVNTLKSESYKVFAIEQAHGSISLEMHRCVAHQKYALVLGNEVKGVQQSVVDACDACLEIPQFGTKHSLNVSVAGGIVIWHFFNELRSLLQL